MARKQRRGGQLNEAVSLEVFPGARTGVLGASPSGHVRLGAIDVWFHDQAADPSGLIEARMLLESALAKVAFRRADERDISAMQDAYDHMERADDAHSFLEGVLRLHRVVVSAARVPVLDGNHQMIVSTLQGAINRVAFTRSYEPVLAASLAVHQDLVNAIRTRDLYALERALARHDLGAEGLEDADPPQLDSQT